MENYDNIKVKDTKAIEEKALIHFEANFCFSANLYQNVKIRVFGNVYFAIIGKIGVFLQCLFVLFRFLAIGRFI